MDLRLYASVFLVNDKDELLLVREGKEILRNLWNLPGGKVEPGEDFLSAAIREAKEETGLDVVPSHILKMFYGTQNDSLHCVFLAREYTGTPSIEGTGMLDIAWTPLSIVETMGDVLVRPEKLPLLISAYRGQQFSPLELFASPKKIS